jgi:hypothetical protein
MTYPNGDRYTGEWKEGLMHGKGEFASAKKKKPKQVHGTTVSVLIHAYSKRQRCRKTLRWNP